MSDIDPMHEARLESPTPTIPAPKKRAPRKSLVPAHGFAAPTLQDRQDCITPGSTVHECLVGNCEWALVMPRLMPNEHEERGLRLAATLGIEEAVGVLSRERAEWIDQALRVHLETHNVVEWAETVHDLEQANLAWEATCEDLRAQLLMQHDIIAVLQEKTAVMETRLQEGPQRTARERHRDLEEALPLPVGIPAPVLDPMKERIVPSDKRAEGQVARKG